MIKRILLAFALVGAIAACNSPGASTTPAVSTTSPESSPSTPAVESPSESPAAS
jgi:hypothetical protein